MRISLPRLLSKVRRTNRWRPIHSDGNPFFAGEVEPCINGQVGAAGAYFGQDVHGIIDRLLNDQLTDGLYRRSRNPMYVAGIGTWLGWTIYYGNLAVMVGMLIFWLAIARIAVPYEEGALEARFGEAYTSYKAAVPRWLSLSRSL